MSKYNENIKVSSYPSILGEYFTMFGVSVDPALLHWNISLKRYSKPKSYYICTLAQNKITVSKIR